MYVHICLYIILFKKIFSNITIKLIQLASSLKCITATILMLYNIYIQMLEYLYVKTSTNDISYTSDNY